MLIAVKIDLISPGVLFPSSPLSNQHSLSSDKLTTNQRRAFERRIGDNK